MASASAALPSWSAGDTAVVILSSAKGRKVVPCVVLETQARSEGELGSNAVIAAPSSTALDSGGEWTVETNARYHTPSGVGFVVHLVDVESLMPRLPAAMKLTHTFMNGQAPAIIQTREFLGMWYSDNLNSHSTDTEVAYVPAVVADPPAVKRVLMSASPGHAMQAKAVVSTKKKKKKAKRRSLLDSSSEDGDESSGSAEDEGVLSGEEDALSLMMKQLPNIMAGKASPSQPTPGAFAAAPKAAPASVHGGGGVDMNMLQTLLMTEVLKVLKNAQKTFGGFLEKYLLLSTPELQELNQ